MTDNLFHTTPPRSRAPRQTPLADARRIRARASSSSPFRRSRRRKSHKKSPSDASNPPITTHQSVPHHVPRWIDRSDRPRAVVSRSTLHPSRARTMFALSSKITFAKTVVDRASSRRASKRDAHVVKVRTARMDSDRARAVVPTSRRGRARRSRSIDRDRCARDRRVDDVRGVSRDRRGVSRS